MRLIIILQMVLVAGAGERLMQNKMGKALANDLKAVLTALQRSDSHKLKLPAGTLDTEETVIGFLFDKENAAMVKKVMSEVDTLDLTGMNLWWLPVHVIQQLPKLKTLILDGNERLIIPQDAIKMIRHPPIERVSIRNSNMGIETFRTLLELPNLTKLDISGNESFSTYMYGDKFGDLTTRLVELRAAWCDFDNSWLDAILKCVNLKFLDVSGNTELFRGKGPTTGFSFMKDLTGLHVSWCDLSSTWLNEIFKCTNLIDLNVMGNTNIATHTKKLGNLSSLKILNVNKCDLTTESLNEICKSKSLVELNVGNNDQLWEGTVNFGECKDRLVRLSIAGTGASEAVLRAICGLPGRWGLVNALTSIFSSNAVAGFPNLAIFDVSRNEALGDVISQKDFSFGCLANTLTELHVAKMDIKSNDAIKAISGCKKLCKLNASQNPALWSGAPDFGCLKSQLQVLNVGSTNLSPDILSEILQFDQLVELNICHNDTACQGLGSNGVSTGGMKNTLKRFNMKQTGLTGKGLQWVFSEFNRLGKVDASENPGISQDDLLGLNFKALRDRLAGFSVTTVSEIAVLLRMYLPFTKICNQPVVE